MVPVSKPCSAAGLGEVLHKGAFGDADGVRNPEVPERAAAAQRVHGRSRNAQALRDPPYGETRLSEQASRRLPARVSKGVSKEWDFTCGLMRWVRVDALPMFAEFRYLRPGAAPCSVGASTSGAEGHRFESCIARHLTPDSNRVLNRGLLRLPHVSPGFVEQVDGLGGRLRGEVHVTAGIHLSSRVAMRGPGRRPQRPRLGSFRPPRVARR